MDDDDVEVGVATTGGVAMVDVGVEDGAAAWPFVNGCRNIKNAKKKLGKNTW